MYSAAELRTNPTPYTKSLQSRSQIEHVLFLNIGFCMILHVSYMFLHVVYRCYISYYMFYTGLYRFYIVSQMFL